LEVIVVAAHGIMFHHFHDNKKHIIEQGSISSETFIQLLDFYSKRYHIISAKKFYEKSLSDSLEEKDVCLTFDDGLLCQYDIAYPIMEARGLTAFWFIYTSPLNGIMERLEIYRHFRFSKFADIEDFYEAFFKIAKREYNNVSKKLDEFDPNEYAKDFQFYTPNDKRFRFLRDDVLGEEKYNNLMNNMIKEYNYDINENSKLLWLNSNHIKKLHDTGHIIGLHSYSHPTVMTNKTIDEQCEEYGKNKQQLEHIIGENITAVSYPCNSYNDDTLKCMEEFGIKIGFRANMANVCLENKKLEYPREDHANILRQMEENK